LAGGTPGWCKAAFGGAVLMALAGCQDMGNMFGGSSETASVLGDASSVRLVERDVEAPSDGRPSQRP